MLGSDTLPYAEEVLMNRVRFLVGVSLLLFVLALTSTVRADGQAELAEVRAATASFQQPATAQAAGWDLVTGLDHCFDNPGAGAMGYHYINVNLLDATVDVLQPEAMVYAPGPNGQLQLGAVEYIVPVDAWAASGNPGLPSALGREFHLNPALGVYVLHAWIWRHNTAGMFEDWNPQVSCP
jgi:hypothetical protein